MTDLLQASGYAALVYLTFNYLISFGSGKPVVEWINPGRRYLPALAVGFLGFGYTLLLRATYKYHKSYLELLSQLVSPEPAAYELTGAVMFAVLAVSVLLLWLWCWWNLPRDSRTFNPNPRDMGKEFRKAIRHFVRWKGGLDYAVLCEVRGGTHHMLAEGADDRSIARGLSRLPSVGSAQVAIDPRKASAEQKELWREEAKRYVAELPKLDELVKASRQGQNVTVCLDLQYGAIYFEVVERPDPTAADPVWLYLFAGCLNQFEVSSLTAGRHFYALSETIRHIRRGVTKR